MKITQILASITLATLPLYVVRCNSFSWCNSPVPFTILEIFIIITFLSWLLWRVYTVRKGIISTQKLFERLRGPFIWPGVLFLLISSFALFISPDFQSAAGVWKAYFIEPALLFIVVLDLSLGKKSINWVILPLIISGLWLSTLAIWQWFTKIDPCAPDSIAVNRVTGVYDNPNALGLYLGPLVLISLGSAVEFFRISKAKLNRNLLLLFFLIAIITFLLAIFLSKSRGASVAIIASLSFFVVFTIHIHLPRLLKKLSRWFVYFLLAAVFASFVFGFINIDRFITTTSQTNKDSSYSRLCIWQASRGMIRDNLVIGVGLSGFPKVYPDYATCESHPFQYPHNIFLNFWVEVGLVGLMAFLWLSYIYWKVLVKYKKNFVVVGLLGAIVYIFVHGIVDVPYFKNDLSSQFWVFLALVSWFAVSRERKKENY